MTFARIACTLMIICVFSLSPAFSQEAEMVLEHKEIAPHERPLVKFTHERHMNVPLECARCHHDYDQFGNNKVDQDGQACTTCHSRVQGKNPVPLTDAFHGQCKRCHEQMRHQGKTSGPVMCGECHVRR